ncbi:TIM barrel protein [Candidatus Pacearchaeota archaeon]|nr:TIM barrel protein [Candidatus Pacearchaeota archaeon]
MPVKFGPAGLGSVKEAISNLEDYHKLGFTACEIAFTYGAYIKKKEDAEKIRKAAEELGIQLTIHGPYWINLNSEDPEKIVKSKERILECCKVGSWLGAKKVVIHPGFYGKREREVAYENIKKVLLEIEEERKKKEYSCKVAIETTGKMNVFGSYEETYNLVKETGCDFCIDFAHIRAREKDYKFKEVFGLFGEFDEIHIQFSGISYGEKGERAHIKTGEEDLRKLISNLPKGKNITIINESPFPVEDSVEALRIYNGK